MQTCGYLSVSEARWHCLLPMLQVLHVAELLTIIDCHAASTYDVPWLIIVIVTYMFLSFGSSVTLLFSFLLTGSRATDYSWCCSSATLSHILFSSLSCAIQCSNNDAWKAEGNIIIFTCQSLLLFWGGGWSYVNCKNTYAIITFEVTS